MNIVSLYNGGVCGQLVVRAQVEKAKVLDKRVDKMVRYFITWLSYIGFTIHIGDP